MEIFEENLPKRNIKNLLNHFKTDSKMESIEIEPKVKQHKPYTNFVRSSLSLQKSNETMTKKKCLQVTMGKVRLLIWIAILSLMPSCSEEEVGTEREKVGSLLQWDSYSHFFIAAGFERR